MTQRFMRKGITRLFWVPSIASAALIPTTAEVNAGTELTPEVSAITGFTYANTPIQIPDMAHAFVSEISGEDTVVASDIEFYQRKGTDTIRASQAKGTVGFVVILFDGTAGANPAAGDKADVWPATIGSRAKMYAADNSAAKYKVAYTLTAAPGEEVTLT